MLEEFCKYNGKLYKFLGYDGRFVKLKRIYGKRIFRVDEYAIDGWVQEQRTL